jgi:glycosyltransferase involved in cell wall biosynthesis
MKSLKKFDIMIASHVVALTSGDVYGPAHNVSEYLMRRCINHIFIKYPLNEKLRSEIVSFNNAKCYSKRGFRVSLPFIAYISDFLYTLLYPFRQRKKCHVFIGVDPLNALAGLCLRKIGFVKSTVFYSVDYTPTRFKNSVANAIYHLLDRISCKYSNFVWCVSTRILGLRLKQGVNPRKALLVPNALAFDGIKRRSFSEISRQTMVLVSNITRSIDFELILDAMADIVKEVPKARLLIIGAGPYQTQLHQMIKSKGLQRNVRLIGYKPHDRVMGILTQCAIGIALYSGEISWNWYGDSLKIREYLLCGCPVITTPIPSNAIEVAYNQAGVVINLNKEEFVRATVKLLTDDEYYSRLRLNAIKLAQKNDIKIIFDRAFQAILNTNSE